MSRTGDLRLVVDATQVDNQNLGSGQFRYAVDLLAGLCAAPGLQVTLLGSRPEPLDVFPRTCAYVAFPPLHGRGYYYRDLARLSWWLARRRPDVFHALHTNIPPVSACPIVVTAYHYFDDPLLLATRPYRYYQWALRRRVDTILTISDATRDDLHARYRVPMERMRTVHLGLSASLKPAPPPAGGPPYLLSPYNLSATKNLRSLMLAWPAIAEASPGLELYLYGRAQVTAAAEAEFDALLRSNPHADRVRRLGHLPDAALASLYAGCTMFVFPTLIEGFGYPLLEAMAQGACCITRDASAMKEVGGDAVCLVETRHPDAIARAAIDLLADADRRRDLGERARRRAGAFTTEAMVEKTVQAYAALSRRP